MQFLKGNAVYKAVDMSLCGSRRTWLIAGIAAVCLVVGSLLSHLIEPGVRVQKVTLAEDTPALKFIPASAGPHPVALLAHGYASSKEALFRYGEASPPLDLFAIALTNRDTERRRGSSLLGR